MWPVVLCLSLIAGLVAGPLVIRAAKRRQVLLVHDQNKPGKPLVSTLGGIIMLAGFTVGILYQIYLGDNLVNILAALCAILLVTLLGLLDDMVNLPQWIRALLPVFAAAPLSATRAGVTIMTVPLLGQIDFGRWYRILIVPLGITGAANAVNMVAGLNGLEAGMAAVMTGTLLLISVKLGASAAAALAAAAFGCLLAFLFFNWYPAKILPGNSGSYFAGAVIATICVLGNVEKAGIIMMGPYFVELLLKARSGFRAEAFGKLRKDGTLEAPGMDSLNHLVMKLGRFTEAQIVSILIAIEFVFCAFAYLSITF